jgi:hypothetical protein
MEDGELMIGKQPTVEGCEFVSVRMYNFIAIQQCTSPNR